MNDVVISVENLGKRYSLRHQSDGGRYKTLREALTSRARSLFRRNGVNNRTSDIGPVTSESLRSSREDFWALKDVSFEVRRGEVLGIIGRNGAGKSTLLKILSRITDPTEGRVKIKGRVASLLEVGTGFHPELTGRENIYLNGAILGMSRTEIRSKFDEIVAFAETEKFLDTPIKRYSSGMYVRLAFAVAAHLEPEILIVDEVLAVGDAQFQTKCLGKMSDVARSGRTVLFVSHNMSAIMSLTSLCVLIDRGEIARSGHSHIVAEEYLRLSRHSFGDRGNISTYRRRSDIDSGVAITGITVKSTIGGRNEKPMLELGSDLMIIVDVTAARSVHRGHMTVILKNSAGQRVSVLLSLDQNFELSLVEGHHKISVALKAPPLAPGQYFADIGIGTSVNDAALDVILDYPLFDVTPAQRIGHWHDRQWGILHFDQTTWRIEADRPGAIHNV
jgi:lipopolysaccharide transport system ATP-binding protein